MKNNIIKIAITGVESTGKSTLAKELSDYFGTAFLPEIAREYLNYFETPKYDDEDVINIGEIQAKSQESFFERYKNLGKKPYFCDTELTVIKIWYETKYQKNLPSHLENLYLTQDFDLYLLPYPDLVWEYDPLRECENLDVRLALFEQYKNELESQKRTYFVIKGENKKRLENAVLVIKEFMRK